MPIQSGFSPARVATYLFRTGLLLDEIQAGVDDKELSWACSNTGYT